MAKLRVALCITDLQVGGAERCLVELATRLDPDRVEPVVYCLQPRPESDETSCVPALETAGIRVVCLGTRQSWQVAPAVWRLKRLLLEQRPHLVQTILFHANLVGRLAARWAGIPRVVSGIRVAEPRRWHLWVDRLTSSLVDRYVCVSRAVARFSADRGRLAPDKLVVIPNGIDVRDYPARQPAELQRWGIGPGRRVVTFVGRLAPQKGVGWLVDTASQWLGRLPDCDLLVVGDGPDRPKLEYCSRRLGLSGRIRFAGWRPEIPEILAASKLLVLPSTWEGMPNVVLEAMASRLPVVATDVEGVRELLGEVADAQTINYGDTESLAGKIVALMSAPEQATKLGEKNRDRVETEFTLERMVTAYTALWDSLVGGSAEG